MMISDMCESDLSDVLSLSRSVFTAMSWSERDFSHAIDSTYDYPLVMRTDAGELIGFSLLRILGVEAEVQEICISEKYRGRGFGNDLLLQSLELARKRGVSAVFLEVRSGNAVARRLYEKHGFIASYIRKAYYTEPIEDAVIMELRFIK